MPLYDTIKSVLDNPLMRVPRRYSFAFRCLVARERILWPLYLPYVKWGQLKFENYGASRDERIVTADTELVVDGFQGSANSFAAAQFKRCQQSTVLFAHHMHSPTQIIHGVKRNIPVVVTIREPIGATVSLLRRWPHIDTGRAIQSYAKFYEKLAPHLSRMIVSPFHLTISDLEQVFETVNRLHGTSFNRVTNESEKNPETDPQKIAMYRRMKDEKRAQILLPSNAHWLRRAQSVYQLFEDRSIELFGDSSSD